MKPKADGERLRHFRGKRGLSQRGLAKLAGVSQRAIWDIERGARPLNRTVLKLARALKVSPEMLAPLD